ncbi:MAG TPA: glutathione S-transferase N-terminal domain-containing protein [Bdellovibrionota bacterium]|nr:glutathione S-transferase N-terminal domain-containing protein [Bdellovibrionota bacterium]
MTSAYQAKPKLYQYAVCPFCWKVRAMLAYKGVDYETIEVHPLNKKEIAFSNSYRKVPIYIDGKNRQVNDSTPIMRHIDNEFPAKPVFQRDVAIKEQEDKWLKWSESYVKSVPPLIYDTLGNALKAFDYITHETKFSWYQRAVIKYSGALVMKMVAKKSQEKQQIENPRAHFEGLLGAWSEGLGGKKFMGGETPNGADISVFGITMSLRGLPAAQLLDTNPGFRQWLGHMESATGLSFA